MQVDGRVEGGPADDGFHGPGRIRLSFVIYGRDRVFIGPGSQCVVVVIGVRDQRGVHLVSIPVNIVSKQSEQLMVLVFEWLNPLLVHSAMRPGSVVCKLGGCGGDFTAQHGSLPTGV